MAIPAFAGRKGTRPGAVYLDRNEQIDAFDAPLLAVLKEQVTAADLMLYPDASPLVSRLARLSGVGEEGVYVTAGSDAAIRALFQAYLRPGDGVLLPDPTYAMYRIYADIFQARVTGVPYGADLDLDIDRFVAAIAGRPRIVALANPDQPTGHAFTDAELRRIAAAARDAGSLLIIDEAYHPYLPETAVGLLAAFDNVAVVRTFSKANGLAGARLGYLLAAPAIRNAADRVRAAHEVSAVAIRLGCYLLDHPEILDGHVAAAEAGRRILCDAAAELGLGCPPCPANFQLLRFPGRADATAVTRALEAKDYFVKGGFTAPLEAFIRVTLTGPEIMRGFVAALRSVYAPAAA